MMNQALSFTKKYVSKNSGMARRLALSLDSGRALKNGQVYSGGKIPLGILDKTGMLIDLFTVKNKFNHPVYFKMKGLTKMQSP